LNQKNTGYGLDLGSHYKLNKHWNFSLSMTDFGFIRWRSNVKNYTAESKSYNFEGLDLNQFLGSEGTQNISDSLKNTFSFEETHNEYTTYLSTHIYAGTNYAFTEKSFAGLLLHAQFFKGEMMPSATVSLNHQMGRHITLALSYSALNRTYNNIGAGIAMSAGPVQFYVAGDNQLGIIKPLDARTLNVHFGINFIMGRREKDRDHDKVPDKVDACPDVPGLTSLHGCPDRDKDGIADHEDACPDQAGPAKTKGCPDQDGDGIADKDDECPDVAGVAIFNGCPDTDGDSIPDVKDACPDFAGLKQFNGCPDPDGDGIPFPQDKCPDTPGLAKFHGCPDTDNDGVSDKEDKCPQVAGPVSNHGCPIEEAPKQPVKVVLTQDEQEVINKVFHNLEFENGKTTMTNNSFAALDELTTLLKRKPNFKLLIDGHTDNVGGKEFNQKLSQGRADVVKKYLTDQGIGENRIIAKGYGMSMPIVANTTEAGRQKNRRVEFTIME
jgi:outer membrane protein OmpA-like peptidoglycan-associated protein